MTLVSIVTPSLNQSRYLREAIESVRAQTYAPIEHVVVDGGSTDGSLDILRECDDVRWVSEPDRGQSHALNKGLALASGEILGWLNADDAYESEAVAAGVAELVDTGAGLVYADVTHQVAPDLRPLDGAQPRLRHLFAGGVLHARGARCGRPLGRVASSHDGLRLLASDR